MATRTASVSCAKTQRTARADAGTDGGPGADAVDTRIPQVPMLLPPLLLPLSPPLRMPMRMPACFEQTLKNARADAGTDGGPGVGAVDTCTLLGAFASAAAPHLPASDAVAAPVLLPAGGDVVAVSLARVRVVVGVAPAEEDGIVAAAAAAGCMMVVGSSCRKHLLRLAATTAALPQKQT